MEIQIKSIPPTKASSPFSDLERIVKHRSTAVRTESDLVCILKALDADLNAADVVWAALSSKQKLVLCKYFELHTVFDDEGLLLPCVEKTGFSSNKNTSFRRKEKDRANPSSQPSGGLFILVHGKATVSCGGYSIVIRDGADGGVIVGAVLGRLAIPQDSMDFFKNAEWYSPTQSLYRRFVSLEDRRGNVSIRFDKGSTFYLLPEYKSREFIEKLNASLIAKRVFNDVGLLKLLERHRTKVEGKLQMGAPKIFRFQPGQILIRQGDSPNRVLFVATGTCIIFHKKQKRLLPTCVGSMGSPTFTGFIPLFVKDGPDDNCVQESNGRQPISVVALTEGFAFSFFSEIFMRSINSCGRELADAFKFLAENQMEVWCGVDSGDDTMTEGNGDIEKEYGNTNVGKEGGISETMPVPELSDADEIIEKPAGGERGAGDIENPDFTSIEKDDTSSDAPDSTITSQPTDIKETLFSGKLNRSKFLSAIHESFSCNDSGSDCSADDCRDEENWFLPPNSGNLLSDIKEALSKGCGVDFSKCEGSDPFHNFTIEKDPSNAMDDMYMSLQLPFPAPNRLNSMTGNCLGRKRPPEYDNSDPFLTPVPSVLPSRKMHGKTLPIVRRCKGSIDPLNYNEEEWI